LGLRRLTNKTEVYGPSTPSQSQVQDLFV